MESSSDQCPGRELSGTGTRTSRGTRTIAHRMLVKNGPLRLEATGSGGSSHRSAEVQGLVHSGGGETPQRSDRQMARTVELGRV